MDQFTEYQENVPLLSYLKKWFGFSRFKGSQEAIIRNVLQGHNTFVLMPTGGGKSLCYQLPALILPGVTVVISPLIALMKNQVDLIRSYSSRDEVAHFLNSSLGKTQVNSVKQDLLSGVTKILYIAPESLNKEEYVDLLREVPVSLYAVDEAHCISEWGHDFRPEYRRIRPMIDEIQHQAPIIALTATATPKVRDDIMKSLGMEKANLFQESFNRPNLYYQIRPKTNATREIIRFIKNNPGKSGIIYCMSRKKVEQMAEVLNVNGISALPYHAGMEANVRSAHQDAFLHEDVDVIVATIAFGMGIDKPDVRYVIHYDMPKSLEGYYQETGRAGRDGGEGICIAFFAMKDMDRLRRLIMGKPLSEMEIQRQLIQDTIHYAQGADCRRVMLLNYFGEKYPQKYCEHCDNCANRSTEYDAQEDLHLALEAVQALRDPFTVEHCVDILIGEENAQGRQHEHFRLAVYGKGKAKGAFHWSSCYRQALLYDFLNKDIKQYGLIFLTDKGRAFLEKPYPVRFVVDRDYDQLMEAAEECIETPHEVVDPELFALLKRLRREEARRLGVPPYVIFSEQTLEEMTIHYPTQVEHLQNLTGVSLPKAKRYGKPFVEMIERYVEEKEIEPPSDFLVKKVPSKSQQKVFIINSIDKRLGLDEIAHMRGLSKEELYDEIDSIIKSGVKLDLHYFLDQEVDESIQEEIYAYFRNEAQSEDLDEACRILTPRDIREDEIRLVRFQFLSEMTT